MTISLNWLKAYLDIHLDPVRVGEVLTELGLELEGMEEIESIKGGLRGVVVGHVLECGRHPNADKLSVTKVDIGAGAPLGIVCGAPNVAAGQKVLVATVGTTLYPLGSEEPLVLKKAKVRGEESEGMICAADELGLGEDHSGILVLPADTPVGMPAAEYFKVEKDVIYEIGLTPNRSDATNHVGVARDLAATLRINYGHTGQLCLPSVEHFAVHNHELPIEVQVDNTDACPRYAGVCIQGVSIGESPDWLKNRLASIGIRSINNVVDITNFILHELGQPLHAFDYDAIAGRKVIVRTLPEGTPFQSLDEVERKLSAEDLMICDGNSGGCASAAYSADCVRASKTAPAIFSSNRRISTLSSSAAAACATTSAPRPPAYSKKAAIPTSRCTPSNERPCLSANSPAGASLPRS